MVKEFSISKDGKDFKLSENFTLKEFQCHDMNDKVLVDTNLVALLQDIRTCLGKPIKILSAYRTEEYNKQCGGANDSFHVKGMAADVRCDGVSLTKLALTASHFGANGIGIYADSSHNFVHIDTRDTFTIFREE